MIRRGVAIVAGMMLGLFALSFATPAAAAEKDAAIVVDGVTGRVLYERNADSARYPASLTKMMTLYLLFEALQRGDVTLETRITASKHAANQEPTKLDVDRGDTIPVDLAIRAIAVLSANDVAVMVAEHLGGSESEFAAMMTRKARALGMINTRFRNASGLPEAGQMTTARDLALLGRHLAYDFPQYYHYFSLDGFSYAGRYHGSHDNLLGAFDGADGIKTGYTRVSGFNLVTSVVRDGHHLVGVVMGGRTAHERDEEMMWMLSQVIKQSQHGTMQLAAANVPWRSGSGPKTDPFGRGAAPVAVASAAPPRAHTPPAAAPAAQAPAPVVIASLPVRSPGDAPATATVVQFPQPKPNAEDDRIGALIASVDDEDRAEVLSGHPPQRAPVPVANPRQTTRVAQANIPAPPVPDVRPQPKPRMAGVREASLTSSRAASRAPLEEGDIGDGSAPRVRQKPAERVSPPPRAGANDATHRWMVQIGAFADETQAKTQLAAYAQRSSDVLSSARRIVTPFNGANGHKMFRARFGNFAEDQAREVCRRITQRGQTCFAIATE